MSLEAAKTLRSPQNRPYRLTHETFCEVLGRYIWCREWHDGMSSPEYEEMCNYRKELEPWAHLLPETSNNLLGAYPAALSAYERRHEETYGRPVQ